MKIDIKTELELFTQSLDVSSSSVRIYIIGINSFFKFLHEQNIKQPDNETVKVFKKTLMMRGCSANTVSLYLSALRRFFSWCESKGLYQDITRGVKSPHVDKYHKRDAFSVVELKDIISGIERNTLEGLRNYALFTLMSACGLRTIEISRANIEDIRTLGDCTVLYVQGKGREDRTEFVKLPAPVLSAINDYLSARGKVSENAPLFAGIGNRNREGRLTTRTISGIAKTAMRNAGYNSRRLTAHSLRHSAITLALMKGADLGEVKTFARHKDMSGTLIYTHNFHDNADELSSRCEELISKAIFNNETRP